MQRQDVLIQAPPMVRGAAQHVEVEKEATLAILEAENRLLRDQLHDHQVANHTIARYTCCLLWVLLHDSSDDVVQIRRELYERMDGAELQLQGSNGVGPVSGRYVGGKVTRDWRLEDAVL